MHYCAALVICQFAALGATPQPIEFDGEKYEASFFSTQGNVRLVEYVRPGETVENWTKLFAVRNFTSSHSPQQAVQAFESIVKQHNPLAGVRTLVKEDRSEAMIDFLTWEKGADHVEFNVHRYLHKPNFPGLISYQFAYRFRVTSEVTAEKVRANKERWCELMSDIEPVVSFEK